MRQRGWMAKRGSTTARELEANLAELSDRVRRGAYRPQPVRRVYIPKRGETTQQRAIGVSMIASYCLCYR